VVAKLFVGQYGFLVGDNINDAVISLPRNPACPHSLSWRIYLT
jgi:hypothetical protein